MRAVANAARVLLKLSKEVMAMAKCFICGNDYENTITIHAYNHTVEVCGVCAVDRDVIKVPEIAELIRQAEGLPDGKSCMDCKHITKKLKGFYCKRYNVPINKDSAKGNYCDCFERLRK